MPYRLRVAFDPQQFLTLQAIRGAFAVSGKVATFEYVPNSVSADTWTKISGAYTYGNTRAGPDITQGWTSAAVNTNTGDIFLSQGAPTGALFNSGTFFFRAALGYWERTNTVTLQAGDTSWHRNMGTCENYDWTYDHDRGVFWRSMGAPMSLGGTAGPFAGNVKYDPATDEYFTPYPSVTCTYTPLAGDAGYFGTSGNCIETADPRWIYYNDCIYSFSGWSVASSQAVFKRNVTTGVISTVVAWANCPPWTQQPARWAPARGGFDSRTNKIWTMADALAYYECSLTDASPAWAAVPTTGTTPSVDPPSAYPAYSYGDYGMLFSIDEAANCMVAWCGRNGMVQADGGTSQRKTWIMDLATREWRAGPMASTGHTVPTATVQVMQRLLYDPVNRRTVLTVGINNITEVWALQIAPIGGIITSWPLPASSGSTYGTSYYGFPFTSNGASKHVNMAYCPADGRLYATGGDSIHSATDGLWSMSLDDGSWRLDVGQPVYGTTVAPHAYQDGCLFQWMPSRNKFLFGFGSVFGYEADGSAIYNYSSGYWTYDPIAGTWAQVAAFFTNPTLSHSVSGTGNLYGGVYDEDTDTVYVLGDTANGAYARRYNIATGVQDSSIAYTIPSSGVSGYTGSYFMRSRQCQIGRYIYATGFYTNGVSSAPANNIAALWRWGIDDHTFVRLASPPAFTQNVAEIELVLCASNGKLVHPRRYGPEGDMAEGVYVYNPANDTWTTDTKTPAYGAFIQNSVCSLPDGRVAMSGGVFGSQQTHMWFYEAT